MYGAKSERSKFVNFWYLSKKLDVFATEDISDVDGRDGEGGGWLKALENAQQKCLNTGFGISTSPNNPKILVREHHTFKCEATVYRNLKPKIVLLDVHSHRNSNGSSNSATSGSIWLNKKGML